SIAVSGAVSAAERDVGVAIREVNRNHGTVYSDPKEILGEIIDVRGTASTDRHATRGAAYTLSVVDATEGTQVRQNVSRNFTNDQLDSNWTIAENANRIRNYQVTVSGTGLSEYSERTLDASQDFHVYADNGIDPWRAFIYKDGGGVNVTVTVDGEIQGTCRTSSTSDVTVDFTEGTLDGATCEDLALSAHRDGVWNAIGYNNTLDGADNPQISGTYGLVLRGATIDAKDYAETPDSPFEVPAIYEAEIEVTYARSDIMYDRTIRVVPGAEA
ncbi:MAG: hypothetical protein ACOC8O_04845, partial [Natronomonas sp.]